jgi:hypothetical protein
MKSNEINHWGEGGEGQHSPRKKKTKEGRKRRKKETKRRRKKEKRREENQPHHSCSAFHEFLANRR